ncbi:hypothetical protein [Paenibacillus borealis]|nr:hypothetical protein [Paenibacillus borealis]
MNANNYLCGLAVSGNERDRLRVIFLYMESLLCAAVAAGANPNRREGAYA